MAAPFPSPTSKWHTTAYPSISPDRAELSAKGKTVIVTGGGTGIGAETARSFAAAGASRIAILGRREQPLLETKASIEKEFGNVEVFVASTDIANRDQVDSVFARFANNGKVDVLVQNAAVAGPLAAVGSLDTKEFLNAINVNLGGNLNVAQAFLKHAAQDAVVVDVNSLVAHFNVPGFAAYGVSKLGVFRLWDSVAFMQPGISVFHIQPGVVDTDMNRENGGVKAMDHVSLPASFMVWLASPEARFLKNKFLFVNWDVDELKARAKEIENSREFNIDLVGWPWGVEKIWQP